MATTGPAATLLIAPDLAADPGLPALTAGLDLRRAAWRRIEGAIAPRTLLLAMRAAAADPARSWLATRDQAWIPAAATAGLVGVIVVGTGTDADQGVMVRFSPDVAGITIAMVPRGGGCWH